MGALRGLGRFELVTNGNSPAAPDGTGQPVLISPPHTEFSLEYTLNTEDINAFINDNGVGEQRVFDILRTTSSWLLTITGVNFSWTLMQFLLNEFEGTSASFDYNRPRRSVVPTGLTIDTGEVGLAAAADVKVSYISRGTWGRTRGLTVVTAAPGSADEVQIAAGVLTFHADAAGAAVDYSYRVTLTNNQTIGVEGAFSNIGDVNFTGVLKDTGDSSTTGVGIKITRMAQSGGFTLGAGGGVNTFPLVYRPLVEAGKRTEVEAFLLA